MHITLFVPELIWPEANDLATLQGLACPQLEKLLSRGRMRLQGRASLEATLARLWQPADDASLARWRLMGEVQDQASEPLPTGFRWVCADPIHLRFHQERIIVGDGSTFDLDTAEAQALVAALNHEFSDIGQFLAPHPQRWYLSLHEKHLLDTPPLSSVAGRQLHTEQLAAPHHGWLRRLQNEIQMLLHSHPVNQAREATGKPEINGLWLWGSGSSSTAVNTAFDTVWSSNTLARGLGLSQGAKIHPQARCLKDILAHPGSQQNLVVLEDLLSPALYEESTRWRLALENLETLWFAPLADALSRGQVKAAHLVCSGFHGQLDWVLTPSDRWRFWKRPQALARLTQSLAESHPLP